jgi:hypothetical protein
MPHAQIPSRNENDKHCKSLRGFYVGTGLDSQLARFEARHASSSFDTRQVIGSFEARLQLAHFEALSPGMARDVRMPCECRAPIRSSVEGSTEVRCNQWSSQQYKQSTIEACFPMPGIRPD